MMSYWKTTFAKVYKWENLRQGVLVERVTNVRAIIGNESKVSVIPIKVIYYKRKVEPFGC